jgi:hypothetical protein
MPRILHNNIWYSPVDSASMYESIYESKILNSSDYLFPGYFCLPFKKQVESIYGPAIPDLVLIDKEYREWIVIEVELEHHALQGDVLDQVVKFAAGEYTISHADYLATKDNSLDIEKLRLLVTGIRPKISVMVPVQKPEWWRILLQYNATIAVIEVWEDDTGRNLLRVNGDQPTVKSSEFLTNLFRDRNIAKGLKIENPAVLASEDDKIRMTFRGLSSEWVIIRSKASAWLMPTGKYPLDDVSALSFRLTSSQSEGFQLEENRAPAT